MTSYLAPKILTIPTIVAGALIHIEHETFSVFLLVILILLQEELQGINLLCFSSSLGNHDGVLHPLDVRVHPVTTHAAVEVLVRKLVEAVSPLRKADWLGLLEIIIRLFYCTTL